MEPPLWSTNRAKVARIGWFAGVFWDDPAEGYWDNKYDEKEGYPVFTTAYCCCLPLYLCFIQKSPQSLKTPLCLTLLRCFHGLCWQSNKAS